MHSTPKLTPQVNYRLLLKPDATSQLFRPLLDLRISQQIYRLGRNTDSEALSRVSPSSSKWIKPLLTLVRNTILCTCLELRVLIADMLLCPAVPSRNWHDYHDLSIVEVPTFPNYTKACFFVCILHYHHSFRIRTAEVC